MVDVARLVDDDRLAIGADPLDVVLVAMAGKSSLHLMRQFKQRVTAIGARIYGVVLNGLKADSQDYYYYYGSGYYSYYSQAEEDPSTPYMDDVEK